MISRQKRKSWETKLRTRAAAAQAAAEDVLVAIYEAKSDGLSQADIARHLGDKSPSGIAAKALKGKSILERRRGGNPT